MSRKPRNAPRERGESPPSSSTAAPMADHTSPPRAASQLADARQRAFAEATSWDVEDALEGRHVMVVAQDAEVGQRVLDLATLVEARAAHELVGQPVAQERLLERPALGVGAVHDGDVLAPVDIVVAIVGATSQHGAAGSAPSNERLDLPGHPFGFLVFAVGLETLDERATRVLRPEPLVLAPLVALDDGVRRVEDELRGAVVLLELDDRGIGVVGLEVEDVAQVGAAPAVDGLVVVAHHGEVAMLGRQHAHPEVLGAVRVLVLVDVEVAPAGAVAGKHGGRLLEEAHGLGQQVVEVEARRGLEARLVARVGLGEARFEITLG